MQFLQTIPWSLNLEAKQKGGIKGLTLNTSAVAKSISTLPFCANVSASLCKLAGINGNSEYDGSEKADFQKENFVLKTMSVVESYVNPFDCKEKELVNIMTSEVAENSIQDSLSAAEEDGARAVEVFVAGQSNPFSKIKVVIMDSSLKKGKEQNMKAFSCIQEELEVTRKILIDCGSTPTTSLSVLRRLMPYEVLPVSPSLFERTGTGAGIWLRTGSKAALIYSIRMLSIIDSWHTNVTRRPEAKQAVLLDFMAFIRTQIQSKTETLENFACRMLQNITKELTDLTELHVISDRYDSLHLINDLEGCPILLKKKNSSGCHSRRSDGTISTFIISRSVTLENWELMLTQSPTKAKIAEVIFEISKDQIENTPFPLVGLVIDLKSK
ncbi:hypothetical protein QYM36_002907 [Artemia franciscana]|uniref:Uncharacterized protein n=1 Tax=Artemia franciscana TaxID=6661 RepID=A0AA88LI30_ARTSF|nr:hypothetical protein QYM36_002907 [Artemia franciscana]